MIFGKESLSQLVICALTQYLMVDYELSIEQALEVIFQKNLSSTHLKIEKCYIVYLKQLETYLKHLSINFFANKKSQVQYAPVSLSKEAHTHQNSKLIMVKNKKFDFDDFEEDEDESDFYDDEDDDIFQKNKKFSNLNETNASKKMAWM